MPRRQRILFAFALAAGLHLGAIGLLRSADVEPLATLAPADRVEIRFVAPAPLAAPPQKRLAPGADAQNPAPRAKAPPPQSPRPAPSADDRTPRPATTPPQAAPSSDPSEGAGDDDEVAPFPRHAYGTPPPAPTRGAELDVQRPTTPAPATGPRRRSFLDRVVSGTRPLPLGDEVGPSIIRRAPPKLTRDEQTRANVGRVATVVPDVPGSERSPRYTRSALDEHPDGSFSYQGSGWAARVAPDGSVEFEENLASFSFGEPPELGRRLNKAIGFDLFRDYSSGAFDATDALMRLAEMDPYAAEKQCFLDDTKSLRRELFVAHRDEQLHLAVTALRGHLDELWREGGRDEATRRRAVFALWDDCNQERSGEVARAVIERWIRDRLPAGSEGAYTAAELVELNKQRRSKRVFAPYVASASVDAGVTSG